MENTIIYNNINKPVRSTMLQYGKQTIEQCDKDAVLQVLDENNLLTTGPKVVEFESKCKEYCGAKYALAVNSATAALHCAIACLNLSSTDEVIVSGISFVASANCVVYCGAKPIFCDIEEDTMNMDGNKVESLITSNTKAIISVDFAGQLCDYETLIKICNKNKLVLIQDAAHSWGIQHNNRYVGNIADITTLSFHPVKNMTTCEGGMILTNNESFYNKMKTFRQHGIDIDYNERNKTNMLSALMTTIGYNYRIPDLLCALGISQLNRLNNWIIRRNEIANKYRDEINNLNKELNTTIVSYLTQNFPSAYHLFVIKLNLDEIKCDRYTIFKALKSENIGVNIHYLPIHLHPFYQDKYNTKKGQLPIAEKVYDSIISLPIFPTMTNEDINHVIMAIRKVCLFFKK
jgi:perosamine synthetase